MGRLESLFWNVVGSAVAQVILPPAGAAGVGVVIGASVPDWVLGVVAALVAVAIFAAMSRASARSRDQKFADALTEIYDDGVHRILNLPIADLNSWRVTESGWQERVTKPACSVNVGTRSRCGPRPRSG